LVGADTALITDQFEKLNFGSEQKKDLFKFGQNIGVDGSPSHLFVHFTPQNSSSFMEVDDQARMSHKHERESSGFMSTRQKESDASDMSHSDRSNSSQMRSSRRIRNKF